MFPLLRRALKVYYMSSPQPFLTTFFHTGSFKMLSSHLLSCIQKPRKLEDGSTSSLLTSITSNLRSLPHQHSFCFLKWLFCLQNLNLHDPSFWNGQFVTSPTSASNQKAQSSVSSNQNAGPYHVLWERDVIGKGALLLYCEVVLSQLKVWIMIVTNPLKSPFPKTIDDVYSTDQVWALFLHWLVYRKEIVL